MTSYSDKKKQNKTTLPAALPDALLTRKEFLFQRNRKRALNSREAADETERQGITQRKRVERKTAHKDQVARAEEESWMEGNDLPPMSSGRIQKPKWNEAPHHEQQAMAAVAKVAQMKRKEVARKVELPEKAEEEKRAKAMRRSSSGVQERRRQIAIQCDLIWTKNEALLVVLPLVA
ncbi:MAG: hypothetical protein Q9187_006769 [Circinaria calcarea]